MPHNPLTDFRKYAGTVYQPYILPIIPVGAQLSPDSKIAQEMLGKIPGRYNAQKGWWAGFDWQNNRATPTQLERWEMQQLDTGPNAAGMNTRWIHGLDLDIEDEAYRDTVWKLADKHFGATPVIRRREESPRAVLFYKHQDHTAPIRKFRGAYEDVAGQKQMTEFLGMGQQVVLEGPHAKGKMHYWHDGGLVEHEGRLPEVCIEQVNAFFVELDEISRERFGFVKVKLSLPTASDHAAAVSVDSLTSPHLARDMDMLARAINAIDINHPSLADYEDWLNLFRAMWAACGGSRAFYSSVIWPWLQGNPDNREEDMELRLASFRDSQLGADYVYGVAAQFGFMDGQYAQAKEMFDGLSSPLGASGVDGGGDGGDAPGPTQPSLPAGPVPPGDTHWEIARSFINVFGHEWRYNVDAKRWFRFTGQIWKPSDTVLETLGEMMAGQSDLILQTVAGQQGAARARVLKSMGAIASVRNLLQGHSAIIVTEADFDAHPHLLNTPEGVFDLRTGARIDHDPELLLRQMTLVAPDYTAIGDYERRCALFFHVLHNMAAGREWVIPALRHWFAYCLTGDLRHQSLMFLHGPPGVGKSQIVQAIFEILYTYALLIDESSLSKNGGDAKRFDMADWIGKRMGFMDETQLGMTWDETRMSKSASAEELSAELKFGRRVKFANTLKITVVGNHKPNFVAAETGGLTSRMLLVEAQGESFRNAAQEIKNLSRRIVEEEGAAVLMWALEACVADYCTPGLFREVMVEPRRAAVEYAREDSLMYQWGTSRMRAHPDLDIDTSEAHDQFMKFAKDRDDKAHARIKRSAFKQALKSTFPAITFGNRTKAPNKNRDYIIGFGQDTEGLPDMGTVVPFPRLDGNKQ